MHAIFTALIYKPLYNGLILLISFLPGQSVGLAVIIFTCFVKIVLFPLSQKSVKTQFEMKKIEPELEKIKQQYKDDKKGQAEKIMLLYKEKKINPFSGILLMFIQLPFLFALYYIFLRGGLPIIDAHSIYSFTKIPSNISMDFFGINAGEKSIVFAIIAAIAQFIQMQVAIPKTKKKEKGEAPSFKDELAKSMTGQMKYVMPFIIFLIAKSFPMVVALYLITSSLFAVGQEFYVRRKGAIVK